MLARRCCPLITWGLVTTKGPYQARENIGIYRQQLLGKNRLIMRWLSHRGGALDYLAWQAAFPGERFPIAVTLGCDPATLLAAVTPIPDTLSEYAFAGLLRGQRTQLVRCIGNELHVPATSKLFSRDTYSLGSNRQKVHLAITPVTDN